MESRLKRRRLPGLPSCMLSISQFTEQTVGPPQGNKKTTTAEPRRIRGYPTDMWLISVGEEDASKRHHHPEYVCCPSLKDGQNLLQGPPEELTHTSTFSFCTVVSHQLPCGLKYATPVFRISSRCPLAFHRYYWKNM